MGGIGSGRRWGGGKPTTDDYHSLDIRWLKREGLFEAEGWRTVTWSRMGEVRSRVELRFSGEVMRLKYKHQSGGGDWEDQQYPVHIDTSPCHLGGERHWFLCPAVGCGRRVAILYAANVFVCRHCLQLAYQSQREEGFDRATRRADRIREKLGWEGGILNGPGPKPKGMHHRTFQRLWAEHQALCDVSLRGAAEKFGIEKHRL